MLTVEIVLKKAFGGCKSQNAGRGIRMVEAWRNFEGLGGHSAYQDHLVGLMAVLHPSLE